MLHLSTIRFGPILDRSCTQALLETFGVALINNRQSRLVSVFCSEDLTHSIFIRSKTSSRFVMNTYSSFDPTFAHSNPTPIEIALLQNVQV